MRRQLRLEAGSAALLPRTPFCFGLSASAVLLPLSDVGSALLPRCERLALLLLVLGCNWQCRNYIVLYIFTCKFVNIGSK